jgi:glucokinase
MEEFVIMVGDLGGTNLRYSLYRSSSEADFEIKSQVYNSDEFRCNYSLTEPSSTEKNLITSMKAFLEGEPTPDILVLAIAGIVRDNNLVASCAFGSWLTHKELSEQLSIPRVILLNDLQGTGYGLLTLTQDEYKEINGASPNPSGIKVCGSLGTGLGQCFLAKFKNYQVFPSEGGFIDFAAKTEEDEDLFHFVQEYWNCIDLGFSTFISGSGLPVIYRWMRSKHPELLDLNVDEKFESGEEAEAKVLLEAGYLKNVEICVRTVQVWERIIGYYLSHLFASFLPYGGIYLVGGVVSKNFEGMNRFGNIVEGFYNGKGSVLHEEMRRVPIFIVKVGNLAIRGTLLHAKQVLFG